MTKLIGKELLTKIESLKGLTRREQAKECGYATANGNAQLSKFLEALVAAKGITGKAEDKRGKKPNYSTSVHANQTVVLGASYIQEMGFKAGDRLEIKLGYKHIKLIRVSDLEDVKTGEVL